MTAPIASSQETYGLAPEKLLRLELKRHIEKSEFLDYMEGHISQHPGEPDIDYLMTIDHLDFLVDNGEPGCAGLDVQFDYEWEVIMFTHIAWWYEICTRMDLDSCAKSEEVDRKRRELRAALGAYFFAATDFEGPAIEAVRRYRIWTRSICALIKKEWPSVDWMGLEMMV